MATTPLPMLAHNQPAPPTARHHRGLFMLHAVIVVIVLLVYGRVATFDLTGWDDAQTLQNNDLLRAPTTESLAAIWRLPQFGLYVPITYTAWWLTMRTCPHYLNTNAIDAEPWRFHLLNILAHAAAAVLTFDLLRALLRRIRLAGSTTGAFFAALLFALHPVQVESVAWASGLKDVLGGVFSIAALLLYVHVDSSAGTGGRRLRLFGALLCGVVAMLSKPGAVMLPVAALAIDVTCNRKTLVKALLRALPLFVVAAVMVIVTVDVQTVVQVPPVLWWQRPLVAGDAVAFYAAKLLVPIGLGPDYGRTPVRALASGAVFLHCLIAVAIIVAIVAAWRRRPIVALGLAFFLLFLLPVLGLATFSYQTHSTVADHYLYLPMAGIALVAGAGLMALRPQVRRGVGILVCCVLTALTLRQLPVWRDSVSLFTRMVEINPQSSGSHNNLGMAYAQLMRLDQAAAEFRRAIVLSPGDTSAHTNLAALLFEWSDYRGAIREASISLAIIQTEPAAVRETGQEEFAIIQGARAQLELARNNRSRATQPNTQP
jgi:protein O-mannosyl-transferase